MKKLLSSVLSESGNTKLYRDINYFYKNGTIISLDKVNTNISKQSDKGCKFRVWDGAMFHEHGQSDISFEGLKKGLGSLISKAEKSVKKGAHYDNLSVDTTEMDKDFFWKPRISPETKTAEDKVKQLSEYRRRLLDIGEHVVNVQLRYIETYEEHAFVNSYRTLSQQIPLCKVVIVAFVKGRDGQIHTVLKPFVDTGLEVFDKVNAGFSHIEWLIEAKRNSSRIEGGKYTVVLSPKLAGILAHESFGHGMEADTMYRNRALASEYINTQIAPSYVNIVDSPGVEGKNGAFFFDHEGNLSEKTYLVKDGVISTPMADLFTKTKMQLKQSNNSRCQSYDHKNYVRMSNTFFVNADSPEEDLFSQVKDGMYVRETEGGMEDPKGWGVQIQGNFAQRIKDGKLTEEYYDGFALTGFLPDLLKAIKGVGNVFSLEGAGSCGKGHKEWVRVAEGGAHILIDGAILG